MGIIIQIFVELVDINITLYCIESHNDILIQSKFQTHAIMLTCDIFTTQLLSLAWLGQCDTNLVDNGQPSMLG